MNSLTIVDTDILVDAARQIEQAVACLSQLQQRSELAVSIVTQMELLVGCRNKAELQSTKRFLNRFRILRLGPDISDQAVNLLRVYRLSHGLLIPDALIAATAMTLDQPLISRNQSDYRFIADLRLLSYPL